MTKVLDIDRLLSRNFVFCPTPAKKLTTSKETRFSELDLSELSDNQSIVIGRETSCNIQINSPHVSRTHCKITRKGAFFILENLSTTNKTYLNGEEITIVDLKDQDIIGIGHNLYSFMVSIYEMSNSIPTGQ